MTDTDPGTWLRQQREDRGWTKAEMARRLTQAARDADDKAIPEHAGMLHNIHRWEREGGVSERYRHYYSRTFGIHPSQFGPHASGEPADAVTPGTPAVTIRQPSSPLRPRPSPRRWSTLTFRHPPFSPTVEGDSPLRVNSRSSKRS